MAEDQSTHSALAGNALASAGLAGYTARWFIRGAIVGLFAGLYIGHALWT